MKRRTRILVSILVIGVVLAMGVHYETVDDKYWPYPTEDQLAAEYDQYVGEQAFLSGTIESIDRAGGTATIRVGYSTGSFTMKVREFSAEVRPGGVVQVLGTLESGHVITADEIRVVNPARSSKLYKYGVSLVGALLVVVSFFRYWRVDWRTLSVEVQ